MLRRIGSPVAPLVIAAVFAAAVPARASDRTSDPATPHAAKVLAPSDPSDSLDASNRDIDFLHAPRPRALPVLYVTLGVVQAADLYTTAAGLKRGAAEANPLIVQASGNRSAMLAVKIASSAGTIAFAERVWKKNRAAAVALMIGVNGATAAIAAHNARVMRAAGR